MNVYMFCIIVADIICFSSLPGSTVLRAVGAENWMLDGGRWGVVNAVKTVKAVEAVEVGEGCL